MDLLKIIKDKASFFSSSPENIGVQSVINHIKIAERHYELGKAGDEDLFNDAIYRCNQAFEGILREAYRIFGEVDSSSIDTFKIEKYFEENEILKERVLQLFTNYRTEWRNKSTHDYKLYFTEQEVLLAIVSISAFVSILFEQMIEKKSYENEKNILKSKKDLTIESEKSNSLVDNLIIILKSFSNDILEIYSGVSYPKIRESEFLGSLSAYLENYLTNIEVHINSTILVDSEKKALLDLIVESKEEKVIIELKTPFQKSSSIIKNGTEQLFNYLLLSKLDNGILFIPPINSSDEMIVRNVDRLINEKKYSIYQVFPKRLL